MPSRKRLDVALVERELVDSREKAQRLILAGQVRVNGHPAGKASQPVKSEDTLEVQTPERFVSRGGLKLEAAIQHFHIDCQNRVCLDIGASTGGFTDCLLQHGARRVYAVDVGENLIAWKLRNDPRVRVIGKINARYLTAASIEEPAELVTADVSFISLTKVLPAVKSCARPDASFVVLIKPQFEAGREQVERGGVVRDPQVHQRVIEEIRIFVETKLSGAWRGVIESPITGPAGNREFLAWFTAA
jgi:23S rRNA (cytidine1920-2'-O)/16S rRNA (cytidine1409-2'-O)-methyltransferase